MPKSGMPFSAAEAGIRTEASSTMGNTCRGKRIAKSLFNKVQSNLRAVVTKHDRHHFPGLHRGQLRKAVKHMCPMARELCVWRRPVLVLRLVVQFQSHPLRDPCTQA